MDWDPGFTHLSELSYVFVLILIFSLNVFKKDYKINGQEIVPIYLDT